MKMFNPPHPGRILRASFNDKFTVEDAARKTIFPWDTPEMWIGMQQDHDEWQASHK